MNKIINLMFALSVAAVITSCSSGGGGDSAPAAPIGDITGSWSVNETSDATACGEGIVVSNYTLSVTSQSGSAITYTSNGNPFKGTLAGNILTSSGSYPDTGGTTTGSTTITIDKVCSAFSGTATWSWTDGVDSCSGTATLTGSRINSTGCGNAASSSVSETEPNDVGNQANVITAGVPMKGTTSSASKDDDYYVFTVPTDSKYRFSIAYDSSANDINLVLTDVNLLVITFSLASTFDSNGILSSGTTLYLVVNPDVTAGTIPYTLTVEAI